MAKLELNNPKYALNNDGTVNIEKTLKSFYDTLTDYKDTMEWMFRHISDENVDSLSFDKLSGGSIDLTGAVTIFGEKLTTMFDEYGLDTRFIKWSPNVCENSSFEIFDPDTSLPEGWDGGVSTNAEKWHGTYSMLLESADTSTSTFAINPQDYDSISKFTRVSFHKKGGKVKIYILDQDDTEIEITNETGNHGTYIEYPYNENWVPQSYSINLIHGSSTNLQIKFENSDDTYDAYIDAVILEADYTRKRPSFYTDGPYSFGYANGLPLAAQVVGASRDDNTVAVTVDTDETLIAELLLTLPCTCDIFWSFSAELNPADACRVTAITYLDDGTPAAQTYQPQKDVFGSGNYVFTFSDMYEEYDPGNVTISVYLKTDASTVTVPAHFGVLSVLVIAEGLETPLPEGRSYHIAMEDTFEHDTVNGRQNSLVALDRNRLYLAYQGDSNNGKTFAIALDGEISGADGTGLIAAMDIYNSACQLDDTHIVVASAGSGYDGYVVIYSFNEAYELTYVSELEHAPGTTSYWNSIVKIDDTHFALCYYEIGQAYFKTFSVDGSYNITQIDAEAFTGGRSNSLVKIDSTHFILATSGIFAVPGYSGYIKTFSIDGAYAVTELNSLTHDSNNSQQNSLVMIDSTHFILAYAGVDVDGYIKTFSIDGSYDITEIDVVEHDPDNGLSNLMDNSLVEINTNHFLLAFQGTDNYLYLKSFSVDGSYNITAIDVITAYAVASAYGPEHSLVRLDDDGYWFAVAWCGADADGYIGTISLT